MKCPKCNYERTTSDSCPEWQCPSCGIAYAKYHNNKPVVNDACSTSSEMPEKLKKLSGGEYIFYGFIGFLLVQFDGFFGVMLPCGSSYYQCYEVTENESPILYSLLYYGLSITAVASIVLGIIKVVREKK